MKSRILLIAILVAGCTLSATADNKKDKKNKKAAPVAELTIQNERDSLSYAAGYAMTQGLHEYLKQQYGLDSANYQDFVQSYQEAVSQVNDPKFKARLAGAAVAQMVFQRMLPQAESTFKDTPDSLRLELFHKGFTDGVMKDASIMGATEASDYFQGHARELQEQKNKAWEKENNDWLAANKTKDGVKTTASGLQYRVLTQGTGATPKADQEVVVKYEGKLIDGTVFDSSYRRGEPAVFPLNGVIKGWTEGVQLMKEGAKFRFFIPYQLAYGTQGAGNSIPPYAALIFDVELLEVL